MEFQFIYCFLTVQVLIFTPFSDCFSTLGDPLHNITSVILVPNFFDKSLYFEITTQPSVISELFCDFSFVGSKMDKRGR